MSLLPVIDRLVIREVVPPTVLGFILYTFLVVMRGIFGLIEQVLVRGVAVGDAGLVMLATLPHIAVLTIPMSFLFGVLLAVGRMNADNELVALQAGGIPVSRLLRAIVAIGLLLTAVNGYLYVQVIPRSARELRDLKVRVLAEARNLGRIEAGVFHEELPNVLLYIRDVDQGGEWSDVLFYDSSNPAEERLTLAKRGRLVTAGARPPADVDPTSGELPEVEQWLRLEDVVTHQFFRNDPETYRVSRNRTQLIRPSFEGRGAVRFRLSMNERSTPQLWNIARGAEVPELEDGEEQPTAEDLTATRRLAAVELQQRLAIPFACTVFALLGLPLGVGSRSGSRGRGFVVSVAVVLVYYMISSQGRVLAIEGRLPPALGIWLPNLILTAVALLLMRTMGRWLGEREKGESWVVRGIRGWKKWRQRRRAPRAAAAGRTPTGSFPVEIQRRRYATRFPALFDRYVIRRLLPPLFLVLGSTASIYILIDITDRIDNMVRNKVPLDVVITYYVNLMPQVLLDVTPFALMITALILLSVMERQQELTALKAAGISLFRLTVPILLLAAVCAVGLWLLGDIIAPEANREAQRLRDRINGHDRTRSYRASDRQWLMSRDDESLYNFLRFDPPSNTLVRFSLFRIDEDMNLTFHLFTRRARWNGGFWVADSGWFRQIYPDGTDEYRRIRSPMRLDIDEGPEYFGQEIRRPAEMSITQLAAYIEELEESGYQPSKLVVQWHQKLTYPLSAFVMVLLALPFGLGRGGRRVTTMQGIALAIGLGIGYVILVAVFGELGEINIVPPFLGAWAPFVLAILFAVNRLTRLRT